MSRKKLIPKDIKKLEIISIGYNRKQRKYIIPKNKNCNFSKLMVCYNYATFKESL